jgi:2,3-bisphosphoglycerate-independent phosphoglycerate mutase
MGEFLSLCRIDPVYFYCADCWARNAEEMLTEEKTPKTSHTTNKVPFVMANAPQGLSLKKQDGVLGDVAPTILEIMGIDQPGEMGGHSLLVKA